MITGDMITGNGGGSNGSRARLWVALQRFADKTGLRLQDGLAPACDAFATGDEQVEQD